MHEGEKWKWSLSVLSDSEQPHGLQPTGLLHPWDFPGKSTGVGCHRIYIYSSLLNLLPPPTPSYPFRLSQSTRFELFGSYSKFPLAIYFTYGNARVSMLVSQFVPSSPFINLFHYVCVFIAALHIDSSVYFFLHDQIYSLISPNECYI